MSNALLRLLMSSLGKLPAARPLQPSLYSPVVETPEEPQAEVASDMLSRPPLPGPAHPEAAPPAREVAPPQASIPRLFPPLTPSAEKHLEPQVARSVSSASRPSGFPEALPTPTPEAGNEEDDQVNPGDLFREMESMLQAFKRELFSENRPPRLVPQDLTAQLPGGRLSDPAAPVRLRPQPPVSPLREGSRTPLPEPPAPTINVHIGRVEVRAVSAARPASQRPPTGNREPALTLEEYLQARSGGGP